MGDLYDRSRIPDSNEAQRRQAVRRVATAAVDAADCLQLLDVLGLEAAEGIAKDGRWMAP